VRSADGRPVTVTDVSRIVPLWGNITEVVFDLGLGGNVVGRDIATTFAEAEDLPVVTRGHDVSAESVLSLRPTLVLANADTGPPEALDQIRNVGVPVLVLENPQRVGDVEARIHEIATALGEPAAGDRIARQARAEITEVQAGIPTGAAPPKVAFLYVRGQAGVYLIAGPGSGADSMIAAAGGVDAGTAMGLTRSFTPITSEALVAAAPDALLLTTTGLESVGGMAGLLEIPGVAQTPAGRARRVVTVEDGLLYSFGSRTPEALQRMIDQLYGDDAGS
jgi:iron complex transport system substrate-binding protein